MWWKFVDLRWNDSTLKARDELIRFQPSKHETLPNIDAMLGQRRRRWPNIASTLGERLVFSGK